LAACLARTVGQITVWQNSERLYRHALVVTENNGLALHNLGVYLANSGRLAEAVTTYRLALKVSLDKQNVIDLERVLTEIGQRWQNPRHASLRLTDGDLAAGHRDLAHAFARRKQFEDAIRHYQQSLQFEPADASTHYNLGLVFGAAGKNDEAIREYQQALNLDPEYVEASNNLGVALAASGKLQEAVPHFTEALRLRPDYAEAHNNFAWVLSRLGRRDEAVVHLHAALRLNPEYEQAQQQLQVLEAGTPP
jgi:tetratricopeptide (TPR) repeat protein